VCRKLGISKWPYRRKGRESRANEAKSMKSEILVGGEEGFVEDKSLCAEIDARFPCGLELGSFRVAGRGGGVQGLEMLAEMSDRRDWRENSIGINSLLREVAAHEAWRMGGGKEGGREALLGIGSETLASRLSSLLPLYPEDRLHLLAEAVIPSRPADSYNTPPVASLFVGQQSRWASPQESAAGPAALVVSPPVSAINVPSPVHVANLLQPVQRHVQDNRGVLVLVPSSAVYGATSLPVSGSATAALSGASLSQKKPQVPAQMITTGHMPVNATGVRLGGWGGVHLPPLNQVLLSGLQ
jgi:hypothetical protein